VKLKTGTFEFTQLSGLDWLTALNKTKTNDLIHISGKTPLICKEIWVSPYLAGVFPFIFSYTVKSAFSYNIAK
jgi:hypothetical protein